jgi:hypothetical protein
VLQLYREKYFDLNVRHFHEKLREGQGMGLSYTWVKLALQGAGLVKRGGSAGCIASAGPADPSRECVASGREPAPMVSRPAMV